MRNMIRISSIFFLFLVLSATTYAQQKTIKGKVTGQATGEGVPAVSVTIKGGTEGTYTDEKGDFSLDTKQSPPFTLIISSIGYHQQEVEVNDLSSKVNVTLQTASTLGQEVVVAATRTPSRILESPVTIERISPSEIRNSPQPSYYDIISHLKGVDVVNASLTFTSPTTRGFNGSGNLRLNQIVDGMDNQAPGLNFSVGNIIGLTDLDVASVELLPGASSALYGPGGMNGAIIMT